MTDSPDSPFTVPERPLGQRITSGELADELIATVEANMAAFVASTAPGLRLPRIYAGHPVLEDATADLMYVLGLLLDCGVDTIAGLDVRAAIPELIRELDAEKVEGFYSYRVGETVLRLGGLDVLPAELRERVLTAVESPNIIRLIAEGGTIPPNFGVVAARVLTAQARLKGESTGSELDVFVERVRDLFAGTPNGWVNDGMGSWVHYDIYTPDMYLFAEPLIDRLGAPWTTGITQVLNDLDKIAQPGGAVVWGRSIGALGLAITIELAAIAVGRDLATAQDRWLAKADETLTELAGWFPNGVIAAHQDRATMFYRGTPRRLQMTLDIYGKLLLAAVELRRRPGVGAADAGAAWSDVDELFVLDATENATVWSYRTPAMAFALPTVLGFSTDYLPSPRGPGLFEQPTSGPPTLLPVVSVGTDHLVPAGMPTSVSHEPGQLTVMYEGWAKTGNRADHESAVGGSRTATYRIQGRSLVVDEQLTFNDGSLPGPLSITIPEVAGRPLDVVVDGDHRLQTVDTSGVAEWRSFWNSHPLVHQIEISPAPRVNLRWTVTPKLRVAHTIHGHPYDTALYGRLGDRVVATGAAMPDAGLVTRLRSVDVLHMAWPEWWTGTDPRRTGEVLALVKSTGTKIVWTQHNLLPHFFKTEDAAASYQLWADAADAVIHHSAVGEKLARATYNYGDDTSHIVIPHGHWGHQYGGMRATSREMVELEEGWGPCAIRLGIIGAPRQEKDIQAVIDAVAACPRDDIQLVARVDLNVRVPDDRRIIAEYGHVEDHRYHRRLAAYDALVLPFNKPGMMTTGTAFDCIGAGVPAVTAEWDFFDETFRGADIRYGSSTEDLIRCLESLDRAELERAKAATTALQPYFSWDTIAERTLAVLEDVARSG